MHENYRKMQKYYFKGGTDYMTILMQVTHEKYKRVAVFVKSFFDGETKA